MVGGDDSVGAGGHAVALVLLLVVNLSKISTRDGGRRGRRERRTIGRRVMSRGCGVDIDATCPHHNGAICLSSPCSLRVEGSSIVSCLPFCKHTCSVPCNKNSKLVFGTPLSRCRVGVGGGKTTGVRFVTQDPRSEFGFDLAVCPGNSADVGIGVRGHRSVDFSKRVTRGRL